MKTPMGSRWPTLCSSMAGLCVFVLGASVLVGWRFDISALKSVFPGLVTMKPNTAMGLLLCGGALALLARKKVSKPFRFSTVVMAIAVIGLGMLTLGEYFFGWELGIDQLLFRDVANLAGTPQPGRMSPATAFCLILTGGSILMTAQRSALRLRLSILSALGAALIVLSGLALSGYAMDEMFGLRLWNYTGMALHSAAAFLVLGCGLLAFVRSEGGLNWWLDTFTTGGFAVGVMALIVTAGISYHFTGQLQESARWVSHTQEVLKEIEEVSVGVATLGSSQRGYINTGNDRLLDQEGETKTAIFDDLNAVRKLTADNPHQKPRLDEPNALTGASKRSRPVGSRVFPQPSR